MGVPPLRCPRRAGTPGNPEQGTKVTGPAQPRRGGACSGFRVHSRGMWAEVQIGRISFGISAHFNWTAGMAGRHPHSSRHCTWPAGSEGPWQTGQCSEAARKVPSMSTMTSRTRRAHDPVNRLTRRPAGNPAPRGWGIARGGATVVDEVCTMTTWMHSGRFQGGQRVNEANGGLPFNHLEADSGWKLLAFKRPDSW